MAESRPMTSSRGDRMWGDGLAAPEAPPAPRLGADLRAARERLGWTLPAIAAHLRIRLPFLEAIEQGRTQDLPGSAYAAGFIRTYAQALGLDVDEVARRFRAEAGEVSRKTELDFPSPVPDRGVPALAVVFVGGLLVIGAYAGWYRLSGNARPPADAVQVVPPRLAPLVADKPLSGATDSAPAAAPPAPTAPPGPAGPPARLAAASPPAPPVAVAPPPAVSPGSAAAATAEPALAPIVPEPAPAAAGAQHLALRATADAWMQVRTRAGQMLLNRVLRAGETWPVPAAQSALLLTTGNAGGTELVVDGVAGAPLGGDGAVRRDLPLGAPPDARPAGQASGVSAPAHRLVLPHNQ